MKTLLIKPGVIAASFALLAVGCHSAPTRIYPLMPSRPAAALRSASPTLRVDSVHIPPDWDRIEILTPIAGGGLKINDFDRWAAPLGQALRQVLTVDLQSRLAPDSVVYPHLPKPRDALGINLEILEFTCSGTECTLQASWIIAPAQNPAAATRHDGIFNTPISSDTPVAITMAWSTLLGQIADRIAADATTVSAP